MLPTTSHDVPSTTSCKPETLAGNGHDRFHAEVHALDGFMPIKAHDSDVGFDCRAAIDTPLAIQPGYARLVPLGFSIATPHGYTADVRPRSGLSAKGIVATSAGLASSSRSSSYRSSDSG